MKTYKTKCIKCNGTIYVSVPNSMFKRAIQQSEIVCPNCSERDDLELYQVEEL